MLRACNKKMLCPGESKKKKKTITIMDLDELPPDFDYDFLDESKQILRIALR